VGGGEQHRDRLHANELILRNNHAYDQRLRRIVAKANVA
jgi:hypothetical protein